MDMSAADFEAQFLTQFAAPKSSAEIITDFDLSDLETESAVTRPEIAPDFEWLSAESLELSDSTSTADDEQIKVIGNLRIGIPLYNVYLNEADEWSRRLLAEVSEWAMERSLPVTDSAVSFAHSLAGSSATVGFSSLSEIARVGAS